MKRILSVLALAASASVAMAFTPITNVVTIDTGTAPNQVFSLQSLTAGGNTFSASAMSPGDATGPGTVWDPTLPFMEDFDLNTRATGSGDNSTHYPLDVVFAVFTNSNGILPDFYLFEAGGDPDDVRIQVIFPDDTFGGIVVMPTTVSATGWGNTGRAMTQQQSGQAIVGVAWDVTEMLGADNLPLPANAQIKGVRILRALANFGGIDPCAFLAASPPSGFVNFIVTPAVSSTNVGDVFEITITAKDGSNVTVDNSFTTVSVAAPGSLMEFDWNGDGTYNDASGTLVSGVKTIRARNKRAETSNISASGGGATTPTPGTVTTTALAFSQLQVLAPGEFGAPGTATGKGGAAIIQGLGAPFVLTVNAVDAYWNSLSTAPADTISIFTTNTPSPITPPADAPLSGGTVTFNINFITNGIYTLFATNTSNGLITNGVSAPINSSIALVWKGDGTANNWDFVTANWTNLLGVALPFTDGSFATFDDSGSYTPAINIVGAKSALSVTLTTANNVSFVTTNNGGIVGTARLQKLGTGNLSISTSNSYTGGTVFTGGELTVAHPSAVPTNANSGAFILTNATVLLEASLIRNASGTSTRIVGSPSGIGGSVTFAAVGGNRTVNLGNLTWGGTGNNLFPGELSTQLILGRASDNTTLTFASQIDFGLGGTRNLVVADGSQDVDVNFSARLIDSSANPGNLYKLGAGTLQLSAANVNYDGYTYIVAGRLLITGTWGGNYRNVDLGDSGAENATLQIGNTTTATSVNLGLLGISGSGTSKVVGGHPVTNSIITFGSNALTTASYTLSVPLGGPGANENQLGLTKATTNYTLTLDAANTYTGPTTITAGTLALGASGSINNTTNINVQAGGTFDVSAAGFTLGTGKILRGGGGVNGNVTANGTITPGSTGIGTLTFSNGLALTASATTVMEINRASTPNSDRLSVLGTFTPNGTLVVTNIGSTAALAYGDSFQLFNGAVSGFTSPTLPATPVYLQWTNKLAVDGSIALVGVPTPSPAWITNSTSGGNLTLDWPAGQGWTLQAQTNAITVGISTNWVSVSTVPPYITPVNPANPTVFYRLWFPVYP